MQVLNTLHYNNYMKEKDQKRMDMQLQCMVVHSYVHAHMQNLRA